MKIIHFTDSLRSGGMERQLVELLKGLSNFTDIDCELITMSQNIHYSYIKNLDIKTHFLLRKSKKDPIIFFRLYRLCKKIKPDILHSWNSMCSVYATPIVKLLGIKFVNGFLRDAPPNFSLENKEWLRAKITFPLSDSIVANSKAGLDAYHVSAHKAHYIHNGFDLTRFALAGNKKNIRATHNIGTEKVVGMVATFSDNKDFGTFIEAAQRILDKRNDVTFVMVGDGNNLNLYKKKVPDRFQQKIKFLGLQKHVEEIIEIFDVGVLITNTKIHGEGISNSIIEYMAFGKPVVATDCGGNRELVVDGDTGFLVSQGNSEELAARITQLLDDAKTATRLGKIGHKRIVQEFSLYKMSEKYAKLYRKLLTV